MAAYACIYSRTYMTLTLHLHICICVYMPIQVLIVDPSGQEVPSGSDGEVYIYICCVAYV